MHPHRMYALLVLFVSVLPALLTSAAAAAPPDWIKRIEPYIDRETFVLIRVDLEQADPKPLGDWLIEQAFKPQLQPQQQAAGEQQAMNEMTQGVQHVQRQFQRWRQDLLDAGAEELVAVGSLTDLLQGRDIALVVLLGDEGDPQGIFDLEWIQGRVGDPAEVAAQDPQAWVKTKMGQGVIAGQAPVVAKLGQAGASPANLAVAAESVSDHAVQLLLLPTPDQRRVIEEMLPRFPEPIDGPTTQLTRGVRWLAVGLAVAEEPTLEAVIQSPNAEAARNLRALIERGLQALVALVRNEPHGERIADALVEVMPQLVPAVRQDRLQLTLDTHTLNTIVAAQLPLVMQARARARQIKAMTHARGIHQAQVTYAQTHDRRFANDIAELYEGNYFTAEYTLAPGSGKALPADFRQWPQERQNDWVRRNSSFILVPDLVDDLDSEKVTVFQRPEDSAGEDMVVVFNDNHTQLVPIERARQLVREQTGKTMAQLIEGSEQVGQVDEPATQPGG